LQGSGAVSSSVVMVIAFICVTLATIGLANVFSVFPKAQSSWLVSQAAIFYPMLCGYCVLRFLLWSIRRYEWLIISIQVGIIILQGIFIFFMDPIYWMSASAIAALLGFMVLAIVAVHVTKNRNNAGA
jgi:hypothetical protein